MWDEAAREEVLKAALTVLATAGVRMEYRPACRLLQEAGAHVESSLVRSDESMVRAAVASAPINCETIMTEESVSMKGEIGARGCHCCRGRMGKGTAAAPERSEP